MSKNHRNRSWRANWIVSDDKKAATHKSGVTASLFDSVVRLDHPEGINVSRWDLEKLQQQATKLLTT